MVCWIVEALAMGSRAPGSVSEKGLLGYSFCSLAHVACGTTWPVREPATLELLV